MERSKDALQCRQFQLYPVFTFIAKSETKEKDKGDEKVARTDEES